MLDIQKTLQTLTDVCAPSGYEKNITDVAGELLRPFVDSIDISPMGNLLGYKSCGIENAATIIIDAHLDEIGFMVTTCQNGFAQFVTMGGFDPRILVAQEVLLLTKPESTYGIIACLPPHVMSAEEIKKSPKITELYIDCGGVDIPVGTVGTFLPKSNMIGTQFSAKSLDNRACFATMLRALELLPAVELLKDKKIQLNIVICGSVQEEIGTRGIKTGAAIVNPTYGVVMDVTFGLSNDLTKNNAFPLGEGACIGWSPECNRKLTDKMIDIAKTEKIPYQLEIMPCKSGTNNTALQIANNGIASVMLSIPLKYMHSPVETVDLQDIENAARLLTEWLVQL